MKKNEIKVGIKLVINQEKLEDIYKESIKHADSGVYLKGSNYWTVMFLDKLKELLENRDFYEVERI